MNKAASAPALAAGNEGKTMREYLDAEQLKSMKREELQALAKELNISAGGRNDEIISRITAAEIISRLTAAEIDVPEENELAEPEIHPVATSQRDELSAADPMQIKEEQRETQEAKEPEAADMAEMVTVRVVTIFRDKNNNNQIRDVGEVYRVSYKRAEELMAAGVAEIRG